MTASSEHALRRHQQTLARCRRCPGMQGAPVQGMPSASPVMLIGQAPGVKEGPAGKPFAWTAGKTMFGWFATLGLTEEAFRTRVYMAAVCRCFPGKAPAGGDRVPDAGEIERCSRHLVAEARILRPQLVIPVGKLAISQLAPETDKLVEVVGSRRLGAMDAARTREAEISIDRRVAKASGIEADRENDEDGIKIIIPSFSAGDAHVILLDVIADGPGALADVAVSYKDLVHLRNGTAKAALSLGRGHDAAERDNGDIERSIFQNYVGSTISQRLGAAGALLGGHRRLHRPDGSTLNHQAGVSCFAEYAVLARGSLVKIDPELPLDIGALFGCAVLTGVGVAMN